MIARSNLTIVFRSPRFRDLEGSRYPKSPGPLRNVFETRRVRLRPRDFQRLGPVPSRPFDAMKSHAPLSSSVGKGIMSRQKNHNLLASLAGNQVMKPSIFVGQRTMPSCAIGRKQSHALLSICRAENLVREGTWLCEASRLASFRDEHFHIIGTELEP